MSRLTKSYVAVNGNTYYEKVENAMVSHLDVSTKLGKLEDLEEELGCPLEVVFKAIYSGIYYISPNGNMFLERSFKLNHYSSGWCLIKPKLNFKLEDYKKTWWLKKNREE